MNKTVPGTTRILFFAALREELGCSQLDLVLAETVSVAQLLQSVAAQGKNFDRILRQHDVLVAVDQQLAGTDALVRPGAEVAIFPPVTGG